MCVLYIGVDDAVASVAAGGMAISPNPIHSIYSYICIRVQFPLSL